MYVPAYVYMHVHVYMYMCPGAVYRTCGAVMSFSSASTTPRSELRYCTVIVHSSCYYSQAINSQVEVSGPNECNVRDVKL